MQVRLQATSFVIVHCLCRPILLLLNFCFLANDIVLVNKDYDIHSDVQNTPKKYFENTK